MKVVFLGTPDFAVASLKAIHESNHEVVGVITMPDKPAGRGHKLQMSAVKVYAEEQGLPLLQPNNLKNEEFLRELKSWGADIQVVVAFRMLPVAVWDMPQHGTINVHGSLLPAYRGAAPINWAVMNGEKETGVTVFKLKHEIDTGDIYKRVRVAIGPNDNAGKIYSELMELGAQAVVESLNEIEAGEAKAIPQIDLMDGEVPAAPKIFKEDCRIDWRKTCEQVHNHVRGLAPYPSAFTELQGSGSLRCKVIETQTTDKKVTQGTVSILDDRLLIGTSTTAIEVLKLQPAGKKAMSAGDFVRGLNQNRYDHAI